MSRDCTPTKQSLQGESRTRLRNVSPGTQEVSLASANRPVAREWQSVAHTLVYNHARTFTYTYICTCIHTYTHVCIYTYTACSIMVFVATTKDWIRRTRYLIGHVREISPTGWQCELTWKLIPSVESRTLIEKISENILNYRGNIFEEQWGITIKLIMTVLIN